VHIHIFASINIHPFLVNNIYTCIRLKYRSPKSLHTRLRLRNIEDKECAHRDAHFQEELKSLKVSVARFTSLFEQALRNSSSEGPSNQLVIFVQTSTTAQPKEIMGEHG
jgi:hypothetical protein